MAYRYFTAGSVLLTTPKETFTNDFQKRLDEYFTVGTDVFNIREETYFSSGSFQTIQVRINDAIDNLTGVKLGDDYKTILFQDIEHAVSLGYKFYFDGCYWITVNTDNIKSLAASCTVRRCNNVLRWTDSNGNLLSEYCVIDYKIGTPDNKNRTDPLIPDGTIDIFSQLNTRTRTIKENQRFLFGNEDNWVAYRIYGGGLNNYLNNQTTDNDSAQILAIALGKVFVDEDTDDIVNGIADRYKNLFTIEISPSAINGGIGDSILLNAVVYLNGNPVDKDYQFYSNNTSIATISGSVVNLIGSGSCIVTGCMVLNMDVTDSVNIVVSGSFVENDVRVIPIPDYILQNNAQSYSVYLYNNGIQEANVFTFEVANSNVPESYYTLTTIDGNNFSVENKHLYLDYPLVIDCTSGSISKQISIVLRGAW